MGFIAHKIDIVVRDRAGLDVVKSADEPKEYKQEFHVSIDAGQSQCQCSEC
jgi:hypothetical protein